MTSARRLAYNGRPTAAAPTASWVKSVAEGGNPGGGMCPEKPSWVRDITVQNRSFFKVLKYLILDLKMPVFMMTLNMFFGKYNGLIEW